MFGVGFIAASDGVALKSPPTEIPEIVTVSLDPPSEMVSVAVEDSSALVVDDSVVMLEDGAGVTAVLTCGPGPTMPEDRGLGLEGTVIVNEGGALELGVTVTLGA